MDMDLEKSGGNFLSIVFPFCEGNELFKHVSIGPPKKKPWKCFSRGETTSKQANPHLVCWKSFLKSAFPSSYMQPNMHLRWFHY